MSNTNPNSLLNLDKRRGAGRPPGSRQAISNMLLSQLQELWDTRGEEVLRRVADEDPAKLLQIVAGIMPKQLEMTVKEVTDGITTDQRAMLRPVLPLLARLFADVSVEEGLETLERVLRQELAKPALPPIPAVGAR